MKQWTPRSCRPLLLEVQKPADCIPRFSRPIQRVCNNNFISKFTWSTKWFLLAQFISLACLASWVVVQYAFPAVLGNKARVKSSFLLTATWQAKKTSRWQTFSEFFALTSLIFSFFSVFCFPNLPSCKLSCGLSPQAKWVSAIELTRVKLCMLCRAKPCSWIFTLFLGLRSSFPSWGQNLTEGSGWTWRPTSPVRAFLTRVRTRTSWKSNKTLLQHPRSGRNNTLNFCWTVLVKLVIQCCLLIFVWMYRLEYILMSGVLMFLPNRNPCSTFLFSTMVLSLCSLTWAASVWSISSGFCSKHSELLAQRKVRRAILLPLMHCEASLWQTPINCHKLP